MKICLRKILIFLIILSVLTISTVNAIDINLNDGDLNEDAGNSNIENLREININLENNELCDSSSENEDNNNQDISTETDDNSNLDSNTETQDANNLDSNTETEDNSNLDNDEDTNSPSVDSSLNNDITQENNLDTNEDNIQDNSEKEVAEIVKTNPKITIETSRLKSRDVLVIYLKDKNNASLKNKKITMCINNKKVTATTNYKGISTINMFYAPNYYNITLNFNGDDEFNPVSRNITIKVSKLKTKIKKFKNFVVRKNKLHIYLFGADEKQIAGRKVILKFKKKTYIKTTNKLGYVKLKIKESPGRYYIKAKFKGDKYFYVSYKNFHFYVTRSLHFKIGNYKILTNGYLRIYLKAAAKKDIVHKKMKIKIGRKSFTQKTDSEGIIIIRPNLIVGNYTAYVKYGKYYLKKKLACVNKTLKDPFKHNISFHGVPNLDYMPRSYVMGDGSATYTLKRSQYLEVLQRDSYCLFLNNKLTKYVLFKTKSHPNRYHIIIREKWNVIEREINKKLVKANKHGYWPGKITVSLKGKAYKYSEVRDVQNTIYTCGPTSASVCSQVLRNYVCEKRIAYIANTNRDGTRIQDLIKGLKKHNFTCTTFYRDSFSIGLNELKKGGCALVFHAQNHYVSILDISKDGKKVLVSNSYGSYDGIPTKWLSVSYMNKKFGHFDDSIVIRLNYTLSQSKINSINCFYNSMGTNWNRHGPNSSIGRV